MVRGVQYLLMDVPEAEDRTLNYNFLNNYNDLLFLGLENEYKDFENSGKVLRKKLGTQILMVTRGERGISLFSDQGMHTIETKARKVHDVSGAGDTAISAFVLADLAGATIVEAAQISNYAAGRVCEEVGVVPITLEMLDEIVEHFNDH